MGGRGGSFFKPRRKARLSLSRQSRNSRLPNKFSSRISSNVTNSLAETWSKTEGHGLHIFQRQRTPKTCSPNQPWCEAKSPAQWNPNSTVKMSRVLQFAAPSLITPTSVRPFVLPELKYTNEITTTRKPAGYCENCTAKRIKNEVQKIGRACFILESCVTGGVILKLFLGTS